MSDGSPKPRSKSAFHFAAGLGSGILSAVLLQPIDLLKTRVQQSGHHSLRRSLAEIRAAPNILPALWRGTVPSALRTGFGSAVYFTSLNAIRQNATRIPFLAAHAVPTTSTSSSLPKLSNTGNLLAGTTARTFAGFLLMPLTVIKVRYESSLYNYKSIASAAADIGRTEGLRGFFAGFGATAVRDAPYAGLYVLFYEQSKKRLSAAFGNGNIRPAAGSETAGTGLLVGKQEAAMMGVSRAALINFSSGMIAGAGCSAVSNPFDAVKTRIQLQPGQYRNTWQAARRMFAEEGFRSFLDGLALRMTRKALSSALAWTVYEELIRRAEGRWMGSAKSSEGVL